MNWRKGLIRLSLAAAGLFIVRAPVHAQEDIVIENYVNDYADMIDENTEAELNEMGREFDERSGSQIVVVTVDSLDGADIMKTAADLGNRAGVGNEDLDNGVVILISLDDREYFMATGSGIQGTLTDIYTSHLQEKYLVPALREGDYSNGIKELYVHTIDAIENGIDAGELEAASNEEDDTIIVIVLGIFFAGAALIAAGVLVFLNRKKIRLKPGTVMQLHDPDVDLEKDAAAIRSSDPDVVEVRQDGTMKANKPGKSTVTIQMHDKSRRQFHVVVSEKANTSEQNEKNIRFYFHVVITSSAYRGTSRIDDRHDHFDDFSGGGFSGGGFSGGGGSFNGGGSGGSW